MFHVTLETQGLKGVTQVLDALQQLGAQVGAVELHTRKRDDSDATNAEILRWLAEQGRDFITPSGKDTDEIARTFAAELERRLGKQFSQLNVVDKWVGSGFQKKLSVFATELGSAGLMEAMKKYMDQVSKRIDKQETNVPPLKTELSDSYKKKKEKKGWLDIGKFTGQLIDNLNPDGKGARNIRLKKA